MSRKSIAGLSVSLGAVAALGLQAGPALAGAATPAAQSAIVGVLGYEGGAAAPAGFHPTAGTVEVEFPDQPLILLKHVGASGHFRIPLGPGTYTLIGCGPSSTSSGTGACGKPQNVTLKAGEVDHVRLVWAMVP
jgi:hypothetical protein